MIGAGAGLCCAGVPAIFSKGASYAGPVRAAPASCFAPLEASDGLGIAEASLLGLDQRALCDALQGVRDGTANIQSVLVMRNGKLVAELYRPGSDRSIYSLWASRVQFDRRDLHDMRSVSKSVVSLLYGILLARGEVPGIETSVVSLYPEYPEFDQPGRRSILIRHLLTMSTGLEWNEPSPVHRASSTDEVGLFIRPGAYYYVFKRDVVAAPGQQFTYSGGATAVLAEIMARSTKRSLHDIARTELFEPIGISDWEWISNIYGTPLAAAGLRLRPRGLIKIGAMMLAHGKWGGRQIVPANWIAQATRAAIVTEPVGGYGYQWWTTSTHWRDKKLSVIAAIGNGGQRLFLVPELDLAVVTTAGDYGDPAISAPLNEILQAVVSSVSS